MAWIVIKEILIFVATLGVVPVSLMLLWIYDGSVGNDLRALLTILLQGRGGAEGARTAFAFIVISPYLILQAMRGYAWAGRSVQGRRWAYLYFSVLFFAAGTWAFGLAWDMFYFMYALGGIPSGLGQFVRLEAAHLAELLVAFSLSGYCFTIFLNPARTSGTAQAP
jgi:hypothetical protein